MRVTKVTPSSLVEVYEVDLPAAAPDAEVLAATEMLAPIESHREESGPPFISWREFADLDAIAAALAAGRQATEAAKAFVRSPEGTEVSERELARKLGVDRITIRRWRGK